MAGDKEEELLNFLYLIEFTGAVHKGPAVLIYKIVT